MYWDSGTGTSPRSLLTTTSNSVFEASTTFATADLTDGNPYQFAIKAINSLGPSQYSSTTLIIAATVPAKPATPTVTTASSASVQIEWSEPATGGSSITNYQVYEAAGLNPSESDFELVINTGTARTYTKSSSVQPGELYHFKVLAVNAVGPSVKSDALSRLAATIPDAPVNLQILSQSTTEISFSWQQASNNGGSEVTDYQILWNAGSGTIFSVKVESTGLLDPLQYTLSDPDIEGDKDYLI